MRYLILGLVLFSLASPAQAVPGAKAIATPPGQPTRYEQLTAKELAARTVEEQRPATKPLAEHVRELYFQFDVDDQEKYEQDILFGAEHLARGNIAMVQRKLLSAQAKLDPLDADEVSVFNSIVALVTAALGGR